MEATSERNSAERPEVSGRASHEPTISNRVRTINLALQGGGAHGAFTWGVLDRLLDEKDLAFEGLSATSAGAMNAAAFAYGLAVDGREGARKALAGYWKRVSDAAKLGPLQPNLIDRMLGDYKLTWSPVFSLIGLVTRVLSPYEFNPADSNPLRDVVEQSIDFDVLRRPRLSGQALSLCDERSYWQGEGIRRKGDFTICRHGVGVSSHDVSRR